MTDKTEPEIVGTDPCPDRALIFREIDLGDGLYVSESVNPDGRTSFWLWDEDGTDTPCAPTPDHERLGPWSPPRPEPARCGHDTYAGHPCRQRVDAAGRLCPQHQEIERRKAAPVSRRDRYGEPIDDPEPDERPGNPEPEPHDCHDGWLGEDTAGRLIPCRICRPHLRRGPA
jgi:hypothetical protein